jgi:hypothetical protein
VISNTSISFTLNFFEPVKNVSPSRPVPLVYLRPKSPAELAAFALQSSEIPFDLQRKSPRRDLARILQREKETLQTRFGLPAVSRVPLRRSEAREDVPFRVENHSQSVRVAVAAAMEVARTETAAAAPPQKRKPLPRKYAKMDGKSGPITERST